MVLVQFNKAAAYGRLKANFYAYGVAVNVGKIKCNKVARPPNISKGAGRNISKISCYFPISNGNTTLQVADSIAPNLL